MSQELSPLPAPAAPQAHTWARVWPLLVLLVLWQVVALQAHSRTLPTPLAVLDVLFKEVASGDLPMHLGKTLMRVLISFCLAMVIGVGLGMLMGRSKRWDRLLDSFLILGLNIPALVTINLREGARAVDASLMEVAQVYRLPQGERFWKVYLPQLYPYLFSSARNGLALIWKIVLVVELLGRSDGVGFQIGSFFHFFDISSILAYSLAFSAVIFLLEAVLMRPLENRLNRWRV